MSQTNAASAEEHFEPSPSPPMPDDAAAIDVGEGVEGNSRNVIGTEDMHQGPDEGGWKGPEIIDDDGFPVPPTGDSKILSAALRKTAAPPAPRREEATSTMTQRPTRTRSPFDAVGAVRRGRRGFVLLATSWIASRVLFVTPPIYGKPDQPSMQRRRCFVDRSELERAIDEYIAGELSVVQTYGSPIGTWCVSNITDMSQLFERKYSFHDDLSSWDVSRVTDMSGMFMIASAFNGDVSNWNTSSVTDMAGVFWGARAFNGNVSNWNTSSVMDMRAMFYGASSFNGNVSNWNTSSVTDMSFMFHGASSFNGKVSKWNTSSVTYMQYMFWGASAFNGNVSNWRISSVTFMRWMFQGATAFNQNLCLWRDIFPYSRYPQHALGIFNNSGCMFQNTPQSIQKGPFCASACNESE